MKAAILGTGRALPARTVTSEDYDRTCGFTAGTLARTTGVTRRYVCTAPENQITLGVAAATQALSDAGLDVADIDLILSASAVPYQTIPATAPAFMAGLGCADGVAAGFDVNATCLGFVAACDMAARMISTGAYRHVLVIVSEIASRALPWDSDPDTAALFGDGAAAAVIGPSTAAGIIASRLRTYPAFHDACQLRAGGTALDFHTDPAGFAAGAVFEMDGKALFRVSTRQFSGFVTDLLAQAGWSSDDVDVVVPHQASPFALSHMARQTGFAQDRIIDIAATHGNQIAASIPFALDMARKDGRIKTGDRVLCLGTSAGVSFGGMAWVA